MLRSLRLNRFRTFALIAITAIAIYYIQHIRSAEFVFEDSQWVSVNNLSSLGDLKFQLLNIPNNTLARLSFLVSQSTRVEHSVNLIIHIVNALILALLIEQWDGPGWIIGSLFLINPLSIQAVAYAAGRSELLSLTELLGLLWFASVDSSSTKLRWIGFSLVMLMMLITKPTLIVFMPLLLIWVYVSDYYLHWLEGLDLKFLIVSLILILCLSLRMTTLVSHSIPLWHWFLAQTTASWMLLYSALTGRNLSIDHAWWMIDYKFQILGVVCGVLIIIIILLPPRKFHAVTFGLGWWVIAFAPRLFIPSSLGWIREHHAYVPLVGFCIAVGELIQHFELSRSHVAGGHS